MDRDKEDQVRRYLAGAKKERSHAERKRLQQESRARKAERGDRGRKGRRAAHRDADELDGEEPFEKVASRSTTARPGRLAPPHPGGAARHDGGVEDALRCLVVGVAPGLARVRLPDRTGVDARLAEDLAREQKSAVAVGDEGFVRELAPGAWRLLSIAPRRTVLSRPDPTRPDLERVVAANVDAAIVVASCARPAFRPRLVDRYLVALQRGGVEPIVCASKSDLLDDAAARRAVEDVLEDFRSLGAPSLLASTATGEGLDELRRLVLGRTVVLVGQSGVGKSSLANALFPELAARVGRVREGDGKGRHTTTGSELFEVDGAGTRLVDTPGVRAFGLHGVSRATLADSFPDLAPHAHACRFADCTHVHEPDCAVRAAVEAGAIGRRRYEAYLRILASLDA